MNVSAAHNKSILIIEDEPDIQEMIAFNLQQDGYHVTSSMSGEEGLQLIIRNQPDLVLLDLMLPGIDGLEVCKKVRSNTELNNVNIIMLTAKGEEADIVTGLEMGADDYMTKPFSPRILLARVKSVLRRNEENGIEDEKLIIFNLSIHPKRREVLYQGQKIELTESEFKTLYFLAKRPGWVFTRYQIVDAVHGHGHPITERAIDVMMVSLRKKMGEASKYIETVRGVGYRFKETE